MIGEFFIGLIGILIGAISVVALTAILTMLLTIAVFGYVGLIRENIKKRRK